MGERKLSRRDFLRLSAGAAAGALLAGWHCSLQAVGRGRAVQPNILFILSDQQRWDTLGCYGQELDVTPNLDRMAAEGVRFENAFTCQPLCGPARACLQTGKYATETGCFRNRIALPLDETTIAHRLSDAGYEVGYIGKWHLATTYGMGDADANYRTQPVPPERRGG
jgi:arylsulfatase A-like enzyme